MSKIRSDVSAVIARRLEALGKSQNDLAVALDVAPSAVSHWVSGRRLPREDKYDELCKFLGITRQELIGGTVDYMVDGVLFEINKLASELNPEGKARLLRYAEDMAKLYGKDEK